MPCAASDRPPSRATPSPNTCWASCTWMGKRFPVTQEQAVQWFRRSAAQGNRYAQFFLDRQNDLRPPGVMLSVTRLLHHLSRVFQENSHACN